MNIKDFFNQVVIEIVEFHSGRFLIQRTSSFMWFFEKEVCYRCHDRYYSSATGKYESADIGIGHWKHISLINMEHESFLSYDEALEFHDKMESQIMVENDRIASLIHSKVVKKTFKI